MAWCPPYEGRYVDGSLPKLQNLVDLGDGRIGGTEIRPLPGAVIRYHRYMGWTTSNDMGKTWSEPRQMGAVMIPAHAFQNVLLRLSSGRILLPCYFGVGQKNKPDEPRPLLGTWDGSGAFVGTEAHHYDPSFSSCYVLYSDDNGETWRMNSDGEIHIFMPPDILFANTAEPSVAEVKPGVLTMMMRTKLGRPFQSWSYDNGENWTRPKPTHLASSNSPVVIQKLPANGHLVCVWNQAGEKDIQDGHIRTRLSAAVSRNGGSIWEFFQNVESIHEESRVEPGPIRFTAPHGRYPFTPGMAAYENDGRFTGDLKTSQRWTNHTICALEDRVLILYSGRCKVLPLKWFYRGGDPFGENLYFRKLAT